MRNSIYAIRYTAELEYTSRLRGLCGQPMTEGLFCGVDRQQMKGGRNTNSTMGIVGNRIICFTDLISTL